MCAPVNVRVGEQDRFSVTQLLRVEVLADAGAQRDDERLDLSLPSILSARAFSTFRILPRRGRIAGIAGRGPDFALPPADTPRR